jgi:uncharacterized membrane protein SpoIIM required for sporulation
MVAPYRHFGALALMTKTERAEHYAKGVLAVAPHMLGEVSGYILASMAGILLSRGLVRFSPSSSQFHRVAGVVLTTAFLSASLVVLAASLEAHLAPILVRAILG